MCCQPVHEGRGFGLDYGHDAGEYTALARNGYTGILDEGDCSLGNNIRGKFIPRLCSFVAIGLGACVHICRSNLAVTDLIF